MVRLTVAEQLPAPAAPLPQPWQNRPRRRSFRSGCCCFGVVLLVALFIVIAAAVAKSGIINVPVFSKLFYVTPRPTRSVTVSPAAAEIITKGAVVSQAGEKSVVTLTEAELTYLARQLLASGAEPLFAPTVQTAINPNGVELFGLLLKPVRANLTATIVPTVAEGQLRFTISAITLGDLSLPPSLAQNLIGEALQASLAPLGSSVQTLGELKNVTLREGSLVIEGILKP